MNLSNEILFLLQGGAGAVSGYITNKYAVNMLFKEYTPLKLGGVIKNRKEQFIEEISELVERDIINSDTILSNIDEEKFEKVLENIVKDFCNRELRHSFKNMEFKDISDFEDIIFKLTGTLKDIVKSDAHFIDTVINRLSLDDDLSNALLKNVCLELFDAAEKEMLKTDLIKHSINEMYENIKCKNIDYILPHKSRDIIQEVLIDSADASLESLFENEEKLRGILDVIYEKTDIKAALGKVQTDFYNKRISDFISSEECEFLSSRLFSILVSYINYDEGKVKFDNVPSFVLKIINDLDYTIYDILSDDTSRKLTEFIKVSIHKMLPYFSNWISTNKDEFDTIIEKSIDEAISSLDPGIKKMIITKVRELFLDNVSAKNKVVEKITNYIENYDIDENSLNDISSMAVNYLKNTKISQIFMSIKNSSMADSSSVEKVKCFLKEQFNAHGQSIIHNILKSQSSKKISDILNKDLAYIFDNNIKDTISSSVLTNKEILQENIISKFNEVLSKNINEIENKRIDEIVSSGMSEEVILRADAYVKKLLHENRTYIADNMCSYVKKSLSQLKQDKCIKDKIYENIFNYAEEEMLRRSSSDIYDSMRSFICRDDVYESVSKTVRNIIIGNLDSLLRGKIKETIKNNLNQYDEEEICDLAQRFMGNELKPLSIFGGILGFVCGILFGFFFRNVGVSGFYDNAGSQLLSVLLMGIVGVMTNVIAINMLFKPYTKNEFLSKIPFLKHFALGYIPAHKENMSRAIGNVIDNDLLNRNYISKALNAHKNKIKNKLLGFIDKHDDNIFTKFIISQKEKAAQIAKKAGLGYITENKNTVIHNINKTIGNIKINKDLLKKEALNDIIEKAEIHKKIKQICNEYIDKQLDNELCIYNIMSSELKEKAESNISSSIGNEITILHDRICDMDIKNSISQYIVRKLSDDKVSAALERKISQFIIDNSGDYLQNIIKKNLKNFIDNLVNESGTIETVFDGKIKIYIDKNLFKLTDFAVAKIKVMLINNEDLIKESVKLKINESLNFFEKIGYAMAGGDNIVDNAVNIMVEKNLPVFITDKFFEITNVIKDGLDNSIFKLKIKDICPSVNENELNSLINSVCDILKSNDIIIAECKSSIRVMIHNILEQLNEKTVSALISRFDSEIYIIRDEICHSIIKNKDGLVSYTCSNVMNLIVNPLYMIKIRTIADKFDHNDMEASLDKVIDVLNIQKIINDKTYITISQYLDDKTIADICDTSLTEKYLNYNYDIICRSTEFQTAFDKIIGHMIYSCIDNIDSLISRKAMLQISEKLADAGITSCINYSDEVIQSVNLKEITKIQIEIMNPRELHEMFISFSGPLFKKLYLYGSFGALFGINLWIPVVLGIKESITSAISTGDEIIEDKTTL